MKKKVKKIIYLSILAAALIFIAFNYIKRNNKAKKEGYSSLIEQQNNEYIENYIKSSKKVLICTREETYLKDNSLIDYLENNDFYYDIYDCNKISTFEGDNIFWGISNDYGFVIAYSPNLDDFIYIQKDKRSNEKDKHLLLEELDAYFKNCLDNLPYTPIIVIGPEIVFDFERKNADLTYGEYVTMLEYVCANNNVPYVNLYKEGFKQKVKKDGSIEKSSPEEYQYIADTLDKTFKDFETNARSNISVKLE